MPMGGNAPEQAACVTSAFGGLVRAQIREESRLPGNYDGASGSRAPPSIATQASDSEARLTKPPCDLPRRIESLPVKLIPTAVISPGPAKPCDPAYHISARPVFLNVGKNRPTILHSGDISANPCAGARRLPQIKQENTASAQRLVSAAKQPSNFRGPHQIIDRFSKPGDRIATRVWDRNHRAAGKNCPRSTLSCKPDHRR